MEAGDAGTRLGRRTAGRSPTAAAAGQGARTPAIGPGALKSTLTRECEMAMLAADDQLSRAYAKLCVTSRVELAALLGTRTPT